MPISPRSGAKELQKSSFLKFYYVLKWENTFNSEVIAVKNTDNMGKWFK